MSAAESSSLSERLRADGLRLGHGELLPVLGRLYVEHASGFLVRAENGGHAGIMLVDGAVIAACFDEEIGLKAVARCVVHARGTWHLTVSRTRVVNVGLPTPELLERMAAVLGSLPLPRTRGDGGDQPPTDRHTTLGDAGFQPPALGTILGRCELRRHLGSGQTSEVYLARHRTLQLDVAVKVLVPDATQERDSSRAIDNEARLLARLNHPGILRILDYDDEADWPYLVVEYVDGATLAEVLAGHGRVPADILLPLLRQVVDALTYAHERLGLVHGDLKPGNILIDRDSGEAKIADFGIARIVQPRGDTSAVLEPVDPGRLAGTPAYIAPEQIRHGLADCDHRSDQYSLGALAYHCLAGRPPFAHADPIEQLRLHCEGTLTSLDRLAPELPRALVATVHRMLARHPEERFEDHASLLAAIDQCQIQLTGSRTVAPLTGDQVRRLSEARNRFRRLLGRWLRA